MKNERLEQHQSLNRRSVLAIATFPILSACSADMRPKRPYSLPIDLTKAGSQAVFEIESLVPELGVGIELVFHFENEKQRAELLDKVEMRVANPSRPLAFDNPHIGIVVPLRVLFKSENSTLYDDLRQTKEAFSASAKKTS